MNAILVRLIWSVQFFMSSHASADEVVLLNLRKWPVSARIHLYNLPCFPVISKTLENLQCSLRCAQNTEECLAFAYKSKIQLCHICKNMNNGSVITFGEVASDKATAYVVGKLVSFSYLSVFNLFYFCIKNRTLET